MYIHMLFFASQDVAAENHNHLQMNSMASHLGSWRKLRGADISPYIVTILITSIINRYY